MKLINTYFKHRIHQKGQRKTNRFGLKTRGHRPWSTNWHRSEAFFPFPKKKSVQLNPLSHRVAGGGCCESQASRHVRDGQTHTSLLRSRRERSDAASRGWFRKAHSGHQSPPERSESAYTGSENT
jgi:hypothetical protein